MEEGLRLSAGDLRSDGSMRWYFRDNPKVGRRPHTEQLRNVPELNDQNFWALFSFCCFALFCTLDLGGSCVGIDKSQDDPTNNLRSCIWDTKYSVVILPLLSRFGPTKMRISIQSLSRLHVTSSVLSKNCP